MRLVLSGEASRPVIAKIDAAMMESLKVAKRASRSKKIKVAEPPYRLIVNDTGQEMGDAGCVL